MIRILWLIFLWSIIFQAEHVWGCALHGQMGSDSPEESDQAIKKPRALNDTAVDSADYGDYGNSVTNTTESCHPSSCNEDFLEICRPVDGVNQCACPEDVERAEDKKCTVFNECADEKSNNCSSYALCIDLPDGYTCRCKAGFRDTAKNRGTPPGRDCVLIPWTKPGKRVGLVSPIPRTYGAPIGDTSNKPSLSTSKENTNNNQINQNYTSVQISNTSHHVTASVSIATQYANVKQEKLQISGPLTSEKLKNVFTAFDTDGNRLISLNELEKAVHQYQLNLNPNDLHSMIKLADLNGDNVVDFGEFGVMMEKSH